MQHWQTYVHARGALHTFKSRWQIFAVSCMYTSARMTWLITVQIWLSVNDRSFSCPPAVVVRASKDNKDREHHRQREAKSTT